ncbi:MAG: hypothetical protein ACJAUG_002340 [Halioglobus sp.]|jgi:hypothetical protein
MTIFFLRFIGVIFASYGAYLCFEPNFLIEMLKMGDSVSAKVEVRAMYGGLQLGVGLLLLWGAQRPAIQQQMAYAVMIACFAGLAGGRAVGLLLDGQDSYNLAALIFETASLLVSVYLYMGLSRELAARPS